MGISQVLHDKFQNAFDSITGAFSNIDIGHKKIHDGNNFNASISSLAVANAGNLDIRFKTGAKVPHLTLTFTSTGKSTFKIYEAATISAGSALTSYNSNRNKATASTVTITSAPTVTATGSTLVYDGLLNGGSGGLTAGAMGATRNELVLIPNTEYLIRLTNTAGTAQDLNIAMSWYEV